VNRQRIAENGQQGFFTGRWAPPSRFGFETLLNPTGRANQKIIARVT